MVPMVDILAVGMLVFPEKVRMHMTMHRAGRKIRVLVVIVVIIVMPMWMIVCKGWMFMWMIMGFGQVQVDTEGHQHCPGQCGRTPQWLT